MRGIMLSLFILIQSSGIGQKLQQTAFINSDNVRTSRAYSHAVSLPNDQHLIKTSGIIGTLKNGDLVTVSPLAQIKQIFENLKDIMSAAGAGVDDIVEIESFIVDTTYFRDYVTARTDFFKDRKQPPPISKTYYAKGLVNPQAVAEIAIAFLPSNNQNEKEVIYVTATVIAKKNKASLLKEELINNIQPSRNEKGCLQYELFQGVDDEHVFTLHEKWVDRKSLDEHFKMPYMRELNRRGSELMEKSEITITKKLEMND